MTQGVLPFKYEKDEVGCGLTALGGLPLYLDMAQAMRLSRAIEENLSIRSKSQGWTDSQMVMSLILLNLAWGDCIDDLRVLAKDEGFSRVLMHSEWHGKSRRERRELERRWRKERRHAVPSPSAVFRYLSEFQVKENGRAGEAFIPEKNTNLNGLINVNNCLLSSAQRIDCSREATLDMDATLVETHKTDALYCYKGFAAYQPLNTWWAEKGLLVHTEFRPGNVPAGFEQLRVFKEAVSCLPPGIEKVRLRSDTAGYQHDLLSYCDQGEDKRFGRIEFAIGCDVSREFKKAVREVPEENWNEFERDGKATGRQWAEVCFVPNAIGGSKNGPAYRYLATREIINEQGELPGFEQEKKYPFQTIDEKGKRYKIFGTVTNMDWEGERLINWLYGRCGESEEAHRAMKEDFAGGKLPSGRFGENAAWWWIMMLAMNLNAVLKKTVLEGNWAKRKMKAIRFGLINLPARVLTHSRQLIIRCRQMEWLADIRGKILRLQDMLIS